MRETKWILYLLLFTLSTVALCSCGNEKETSNIKDNTVLSSEMISSTSASSTNNESVKAAFTVTKNSAVSVLDNEKKLTAISIEMSRPPAKDMRINLNGYGANINLDTYWIPLTDYNRGSAVSITLNSFPAVLQYDDKDCTCTAVMENGCETDEEFAKNTKESYIEAYGDQFESIEINSFEFIQINLIDSVKVRGKVKSNGKEFDFVNIISNCTAAEKTISYMILDAEKCSTELFDELENKIEYTSFFNGEHDRKNEEMHNKIQSFYNEIYDENGNIREEILNNSKW